MTLNLQKNADSIQEAFEKVANSKTGDDWVIFEYEGVSNAIKVGDEGDGGIDEFAASFNSGKLQYGAISVRLSSNVLPKIVLVHWQGETVPVSRKATTTSHAQEVRRFLKTIHTILYARNEIDIEPDCIRKEVSKLPGTMAVGQVDSSFSAPTTVGSVYKPVKPHIDINLKERERFWEQMKEEEKQDKVVERPSVQEESQKPKNGAAKAFEAHSSTSQPAVTPVAHSPVAQQSKHEEIAHSIEKMSVSEPVAPPPPPPPMAAVPEKFKGQCAVALWDYQAGDSSEISFDPEETISEIEQVDEGWWKGRGPSGDVGLFPANYVRLL